MKKQTLFCLLLGLLVLSGCAPKQITVANDLGLEVAEDIAWEDREAMTPAEREVLTPEERFRHDYSMAALARMRESEVSLSKKPLLKKAKTALGTPYVRGGTSLGGFDCSGFVQWAYKSVGVNLPRTAREQSYVGKAIDIDDMAAGDIVAFRHPRRGYHTGIYVGNGKFIHSPRTNKSVEINSLNDPYFSATFLGARRVRVSEADAAEAEHLLAAYESGKNRQTRIRSDATMTSRSKDKGSPSKEAVSRDKKKTESSRTAARSTVRQTASNKEKNRTVATRQQEKKSGVSAQQNKPERSSKQAPSARKGAVPEKKQTAEKKQTVEKNRASEKRSVASDKKQGTPRAQAPATVKEKAPAPQRKAAAPQKKGGSSAASKPSEKNTRK